MAKWSQVYFLPKEPSHQYRTTHDRADSMLQLICFLPQLPSRCHFWPPLQPSHGLPVCRNATVCQLRSGAVTDTTGAIATALKRVTGVDSRGDNLDNQAQMATLSVGRYPKIPIPPSLRSTSDEGKHWLQTHWRSNLAQPPSLSPSPLAPVELEAICHMSRIIQIPAPYLCLLQVQERSKEIGACGPQRSSILLLWE